MSRRCRRDPRHYGSRGFALPAFGWAPRNPYGCIPEPILSRRRPAGLSTGLAAIFVLGGSASGLAAQAGGVSPGPDDAPEAFVHESWTVQDGLPVNSINALLQSRDGYLWIATFDGLVRFDGVRFTVFNSANSPGLPSNRIVDLHEAGDGSLWLRTDHLQLIRFRQGVFTHFGPGRGLEHGAWTIVGDARGTLWVGTERGLGYVRGERFVSVAAEAIRAAGGNLCRSAENWRWDFLSPARA